MSVIKRQTKKNTFFLHTKTHTHIYIWQTKHLVFSCFIVCLNLIFFVLFFVFLFFWIIVIIVTMIVIVICIIIKVCIKIWRRHYTYITHAKCCIVIQTTLNTVIRFFGVFSIFLFFLRRCILIYISLCILFFFCFVFMFFF